MWKEFFEAFAQKTERFGAWAPSIVLIAGGMWLFAECKVADAGDLIPNAKDPWIAAAAIVMTATAGLTCTGAGTLLAFRKLRVERQREERKHHRFRLKARVESMEAEFLTAKRTLEAEFRTAKATLEHQIDALKRHLVQAREKIGELTALAGKEQSEPALMGYLDALVALCQKQDLPEGGRFWMKIYLYDPTTLCLVARYASTSARGVVYDHSLSLGKGAAGAYARSFLDGTAPSLPIARFYAEKEIRRGLNAEELERVQASGVRSVLCAAILAHHADYHDRGFSLEPTRAHEGSPPHFYGVLCFCSTLPEAQTSLRTEEKKKACTRAARLAGVLLGRQG